MRENPKAHINSSDKATQEWLNTQKPATRIAYTSYWGYFLEFTGSTGDQILQSRKADKEYSWEKRVLEFKDWLIKKGQGEKTASTATAVVRGFFSYYRATLQFRRTESTKLHEGGAKYEDYRFSREDLKKMCDVADLTEQYVITAGKSFGFRAGDFLRLTRGDLEPYLDRPVPISIGEYTTQKEKVKAFPFIDGDAYPVIKLMIEKMDREERKDPNKKILTYSHQIQLSRVLQRIVDKTGIKYGNKRVRFHCLRKFLIDRLASHMSESKWKQIVGKKISEGAYVSPDSLREDYSRAMTETCFIRPEGDVATTAKIEALIAIGKSMGISEEQLRGLGGLGARRTFKMTNEYITELERIISEKRQRTEHNGGQACSDGHCGEAFEQITEGQLLQHLKDGWTICHKLNNGDLIVQR